MKRITVIAAIAALAACSKPAAEPAATDDAAAAEVAAAPATPAAMPTTVAADGKPSYGKFAVTMEDGSKITSEVKPDGTYTITDANGKVVETGKWEQKSAAQYCETSDKAGSTQICYDEKVVDGVYTSYNPVTKKSTTIVRIEG